MTPKAERTYDLILWGATGFTGRLVAEYLITHYADQDRPRWALAGRDTAKLSALRDDLARLHPRASSLNLLQADSNDLASLRALAAQTRVVCSTVGPYYLYGTSLVQACATEGTDYCDLTGEAPWIVETIEQFHALATQNQARIVHCCGFDSIPSDLGTLMVQEHAITTHGRPCDRVSYVVERASGGFSGGTVASMINLFSRIGNPKIRRSLGNPYALYPEGTPPGPDRGDQQGPAWDNDLQQWTGPFVMAAINTRVVRRSNALLGFRYGPQFRYREVTGCGKGPKGLARALALSAGLTAFGAGIMFGPTRDLLSRYVLPKPGEGPSRETIEKGHFRIKIHGSAEAQNGKPGFHLVGVVAGVRDPGYGETAKMLSESALCLALQSEQLPGPKGGILTPASAMGTKLIERLRAAKMTFQMKES
jgi:short subunit dehydrogenase-like uncharacterized protein